MSGFVLVRRTEDSKEDSIELPTEDDGSLLLSVLQSQFEGASGLRYKNPSTGSWRAIKLSDGVLNPPTSSGWGEQTYYVVLGATGTAIGAGAKEATAGSETTGYFPTVSTALSVGYSNDGTKRMRLEEQSATSTPSLTTQPTYSYGYGYGQALPPDMPSKDLIVLGLEWSVTTEDLKLYFEKFGEITSAEVKTEPGGRSRGFGFIRFKDSDVRERVCNLNHAIKGRKVDVKQPNAHNSHPTKLFVGCLPLKPEVERDELEAHFSEFGQLTDVYIPRPYRGFGFITFKDPTVAERVMKMQHTLRKSQLNISYADPKGGVKSATPSFPYGQQDYNPYPYGYGQYSQFAAQQAAYQAQHPQTGTYAYGYGNPQQTRAQYDRSYVEARTQHLQQQQQQQQQQYSQPQGQGQRPVTANPTHPPNYSQPHYPPPQSYPQQPNGQSNPRPQDAPPFQSGAHHHPAPQASGQGYDPKNVWSNY